MGTNGHHRRRRSGHRLTDDAFSEALREQGDAYYATRRLLFWGKTRVDYERVLKRFIEFCHERGRERNADIDKRDMRDYLEQLIAREAKASYLEKIKSAISSVFRAEFDATASNSHRDGAFDWASAAKPRAGDGTPRRFLHARRPRDHARSRFLAEPGREVSGRPRCIRPAAVRTA
jgi:hypothetical protein